MFRVDSAKELSTWTHLLVEGCHNAAELIKEVTTGRDTEICLNPSFCLCSCYTVPPPTSKKKSNFVLNYQRAK